MGTSGIIFDIQRFSLHDGPGIRTTVFLKGCPLRCAWCHNPESWKMMPQLQLRRDLCTYCETCVHACSRQAHNVSADRHNVNFETCTGCGHCISQCVSGALTLTGRNMDTDSVMAEVLADSVYYKNSGGGLTVSGGEPLLQFEFLCQLLKSAHDNRIHTCVETSGYADITKIETLCSLVDLFLFDIKLLDEAEHIRYTGVSNRQILQNLDFLCTHGQSVILRCPIIPGINDTDGHIVGIAALSQYYPQLTGVHILPYHNMGKDKWNRIGRPYSLERLENYSADEKQLLLQRFQRLGCQNVSLQS